MLTLQNIQAYLERHIFHIWLGKDAAQRADWFQQSKIGNSQVAETPTAHGDEEGEAFERRELVQHAEEKRVSGLDGFEQVLVIVIRVAAIHVLGDGDDKVEEILLGNVEGVLTAHEKRLEHLNLERETK